MITIKDLNEAQAYAEGITICSKRKRCAKKTLSKSLHYNLFFSLQKVPVANGA